MFKKLFSDNASLSTALSIETSNRVSGDASLSTTLSTGDASYEYEYSTKSSQNWKNCILETNLLRRTKLFICNPQYILETNSVKNSRHVVPIYVF